SAGWIRRQEDGSSVQVRLLRESAALREMVGAWDRARAGAESVLRESYKRCAPGILEELHNIRAFHENGGELDSMDSYPEAGNSVTARMWKDRLVIEAYAWVLPREDGLRARRCRWSDSRVAG